MPNQNFTHGNLTKALLRFSVPLVLSGLLQQLYQIIDSLIVGNLVGENALAAAGASSPISNIFIFLLSGLVSGCTILVSHAYGAGDHAKVGRTCATFTYFLLAVSVVTALTGFALHQPLLRLLHTPASLLADAGAYLSIIFLGVPFLAYYNLAGALLRGVGNSRTPLVAILIASIVNVGLDLLFVGVFHYGLAGAAAATVIAQALSAFYLYFYLRRGSDLFFSFSKADCSRSVLREGLTLGLPRVIQSAVSSVGSLLLQNIMNSFGVATVAAITTAYRVDSLAILPVLNLSVAISVFTGQNLGGGDCRRAEECLKKGTRLTTYVTCLLTLLFVTCGFWVLKLFGVSDAVASQGQRFFWFAAAFYPILGVSESFSGFLQGAKDVRFVAIANVSALVLRVALSYLLAGVIGRDIIAVSESVSWLFGMLLFVGRYRSRKWLSAPQH